MPSPSLDSQRLRLRAFDVADAADVRRLAGDRAIADTTLNVPHPYEPGMAEEWIESHEGLFTERKAVICAITLRHSGELIGAIGLTLHPESRRAELGYWVGRAFWRNGYATEAACALMRWAFETLDVDRIYATHLTRNPASGRVMEKLGMRREGVLRRHVRKWDQGEDIAIWGVLREEFESPFRTGLRNATP
jgi:RimJ/RimL family protein N-acetyltransferase